MAIEIFRYPAGPEPPAPTWEAWSLETIGAGCEAMNQSASPAEHPANVPDPEHAAMLEALRAESEKRLMEESRRSFDAGREQGRLEGKQAEQEARAKSLAVENRLREEQAAGLVKRFNDEREKYLQAAEHEVVKLALAIAARILRRESQMDPLLLSGAVRVALGQLSSSTQVRICVPASDIELWTEAIAMIPNLTARPLVIEGDEMRLGDCVIETEMGTVDLGVRAQLAEIERGFFDGPRSESSATPSIARSEDAGLQS